MHRIWKGVSTISFDEFFSICDHQKNTNAEIEVKKYNTFAHRMHKYWNYLSLEIRNKSAGLFKKEIKDLLKNKKRRQHLLNFGLRSPISGAMPGIYK